jgi:Pao retrotransposon peptidase
LEIKQQMTTNRTEPTTIKMFCDASEKAYSVAISIGNKDITNLVIAKGKVAPQKFTTIPKMELMAAALGSGLLTRLITELNHRIPCIECYCYDDSSAVLDWLKTDPRKHSSFAKVVRIAAIHFSITQ